MYKMLGDAVETALALKPLVANANHCEVVIAPVFTAIKLMQRVKTLGSILPARQGRPPGKGKLAAYETFLIEAVAAEPDITMPELSAKLEAEHGVCAQPASLSRFLCRRGFTYKKSADGVGMRTRRHPG